MDRPTAPFAPGKIFPPLPRDATPLDFTPGDQRLLAPWSGTIVLVSAALATMLGAIAVSTLVALLAHAAQASPLVAQQYAQAFGLLGGTVYGLTWTFRTLRRRAGAALTERGVRGCAWHGAPDGVVVQSFLLGGLLCVAALLTSPSDLIARALHPAGTISLGAWHYFPAVVLAFTTIVARPVLEELVFRGVVFGAFSETLGWTAAAALSTLLFVLGHQLQLAFFPPLALWIGVLGAIAMLLRLRYTALAPSIALHIGYNFVAVVFATLS